MQRRCSIPPSAPPLDALSMQRRCFLDPPFTLHTTPPLTTHSLWQKAIALAIQITVARETLVKCKTMQRTTAQGNGCYPEPAAGNVPKGLQGTFCR
jgi:hypothetical protein